VKSDWWAFGANNSVLTMRVVGISDPKVTVEITTHFQNGTEKTQNMVLDLSTGQNNDPPPYYHLWSDSK
jgi:hypothetical protein